MSEAIVNFFNSMEKINNDVYKTYFLYRIWIKNTSILNQYNIELKNQTKQIYRLLGIQNTYHDYNIIFPMKKYMKYRNSIKIYNLLRNIILKIDQLIKNIPDYESIEYLEYINEYKNIIAFMKENTNIDKLNKKINLIKSKLQLKYINININIFD